VLLIIAMVASIVGEVAPATQAASNPQIVFVCERGAAESLIATAYFNKFAAEVGLKATATFRGLDPQDDLSLQALAGLMEDGIAIPDGDPTAIDPADVTRATHIIAIGCTLPPVVIASGKAASWHDIPNDRSYEAMRDAIVRRVRILVDSLR
jgi:protein-tyrosine-phosphatase